VILYEMLPRACGIRRASVHRWREMEMHATVRSYGGVPEFADALKANEGEVKRLLEGIPGFRAYYLIRTGAVRRGLGLRVRR
jgi:hypothetical protein